MNLLDAFLGDGDEEPEEVTTDPTGDVAGPEDQYEVVTRPGYGSVSVGDYTILSGEPLRTVTEDEADLIVSKVPRALTKRKVEE